MKVTKRKLGVTAIVAVVLVGSIATYSATPRFDNRSLGRVLSAIEKRHDSVALPSKTRIKLHALWNARRQSFSIPLDRKYELFVYKTARWSRRRGDYHEWSLYPEPLY